MQKLTKNTVKLIAQSVVSGHIVSALQNCFDTVTPVGGEYNRIELSSTTDNGLPVRISLIEDSAANLTYIDDLQSLYRDISLDMLVDGFRYQNGLINAQTSVETLVSEYKNWLDWFEKIVLIFTVSDICGESN